MVPQNVTRIPFDDPTSKGLIAADVRLYRLEGAFLGKNGEYGEHVVTSTAPASHGEHAETAVFVAHPDGEVMLPPLDVQHTDDVEAVLEGLGMTDVTAA